MDDDEEVQKEYIVEKELKAHDEYEEEVRRHVVNKKKDMSKLSKASNKEKTSKSFVYQSPPYPKRLEKYKESQDDNTNSSL